MLPWTKRANTKKMPTAKTYNNGHLEWSSAYWLLCEYIAVKSSPQRLVFFSLLCVTWRGNYFFHYHSPI